jgi:hypothetical protein
MTKRFKHKDPIGKIIIGFGLLIFALLFIPVPMGDHTIKSSQERVAINTAGVIAATLSAYYSEPNPKEIIGMKTENGKILYISKDYKVQLPEDYRCEILDSIVVVTHIGGAKGEVRWR